MSSEGRQLAVDTWAARRVRIPGIKRFDMVIDQAADDPVSQTYLSAARLTANAHLVAVMAATTRPGDRVLDVGAFLGEFALAAAALKCEVLAVEANPSQAAMVAASAEMNGFAGLRVLNVAAGDRAGMVQFRSHGPWGQVVESGSAPNEAYDSVPQVTIDDLVAAAGWPSVDFVKMDIEGSEMRALEGAARLLWSENAPALLFECNTAALKQHGTPPSQLLGYVASFGYSLYRITPTETIPTASDTFQPEVVSDYLALKHASPDDFGLSFRAPMTDVETAKGIAAEAARESADHRWAMAWQLQFASASLRRQPQVQGALEALTNDPEERVRLATRWLTNGSDDVVAPPSVSVSTIEDGRMAADRAFRQSAAARQEIAARLASRRPSLQRRRLIGR